MGRSAPSSSSVEHNGRRSVHRCALPSRNQGWRRVLALRQNLARARSALCQARTPSASSRDALSNAFVMAHAQIPPRQFLSRLKNAGSAFRSIAECFPPLAVREELQTDLEGGRLPIELRRVGVMDDHLPSRRSMPPFGVWLSLMPNPRRNARPRRAYRPVASMETAPAQWSKIHWPLCSWTHRPACPARTGSRACSKSRRRRRTLRSGVRLAMMASAESTIFSSTPLMARPAELFVRLRGG